METVSTQTGYLELFLNEFKDILGQLEQALTDLTLKSSDDQMLQLILRHVHSLKGMAGCIALEVVVDTLHEIEEHLVSLNEHGAVSFSIDIEPLFSGLEDVKKSIEQLENHPNYFKSYCEQKSIEPAKTIQVSLEKYDELLTLLETLSRTQNQLLESDAEYPACFGTIFNEQKNILSKLKTCSEALRLEPIKVLFEQFAPIVEDLAASLGKSIELSMAGEETLVDFKLKEDLFNPLLQIIRNAVDHGVETSDERLSGGKRELSRISLFAVDTGSSLTICVSDDGRGLNKERIIEKALEKKLINSTQLKNMTDRAIYKLILHPGFSTLSTPTTLSGRGIGLDILKTKIDALSGQVEIQSVLNEGTAFMISIPKEKLIFNAQFITGSKKKLSLSKPIHDHSL